MTKAHTYPAVAPSVGAIMTPFPFFVGRDDPVAAAERIIEEHEVRHVPVKHDGEVVGLVSERDLHRLVNPALPGVDKARIRVSAILRTDPYVVEIGTPLARVVREMADRRIGAAIVVKRGKLAGVLTTVDVCRAFAEWLDARYEPSDDDVA